MIKQQNYDKQLTKFFSEIENVDIFKKLELKKYAFKIFIGGKGKGKSHFAFDEMIRHINQGNLVGYLRNSEIEIKQMKHQIAQMIVQRTPYKDLTVSNETIVERTTKKVLLVFISTKNYNKLSGNETPFGMIFYDEFNQDLGSKNNDLIFDFFSIIQTAFRGNKWNVWCCGNTKTRNNLIYNMFKLDLDDINHRLEIIDIDKQILIIRYRDDLFKELNMYGEDLELIKKYNKSVYDSMFRGVSYEQEDELVVNNLENLIKELGLELEFKKKVIIYMNRVYELFGDKQNQYYFWVRNDDVKGSIELINDYTMKGITCYEMILDYGNICSNIFSFQEDIISVEMSRKLKNQELFFNDYPLYLLFKDNPLISNYKDFKEITLN